MHFKVINDEYYDKIGLRLNEILPEFEFDITDETYLVLFEFSQFMIENIHNPVFLKCCEFINDSIMKGGNNTEDAIVMQVFQNLYTNKIYFDRFKEHFNTKSWQLFEKYYFE